MTIKYIKAGPITLTAQPFTQSGSMKKYLTVT